MAEKIKQRMMKDREKLIEMYHQEGMSLTDIARKYECSRQYVQLIFICLGIGRRDRKQALRISPKRRKSRFNFGPLEDNFIENNFKTMTDKDIARYLNKPAAAVTYRRLMVLGKKKIERRNFTREEDQFILNNYHRLTDQAIAEALDRPLISVTHHRSIILKRPKRRINDESDAGKRLRILDSGMIADNPSTTIGGSSLSKDGATGFEEESSDGDKTGDSADRSQT